MHGDHVAQFTTRMYRPVLLLVFLFAGLAAADADHQPKRYVCTPCGLPCDAKFFDKPGTCPSCGMPLLDEDEAKAAADNARPLRKVAILIFDGVEIIDYTGPYEVFGAANFDVYTVAKTGKPVTTAMGMTVLPKYTFDTAPLPDVLVVPGGGVKATQNDSTTLRWITEETARIQHTMSVCNGSFILASAGLLDGLAATTTNGNILRLRDQFPKVRVVDDRRYVDNGRIITTAGLSAGIDGALHVVELLMGRGYAEQVALVEEYDWHPGGGFVRAALADRLIPGVNLEAKYGTWDLVSTEGGTDHWERVYRGTSTVSLGEIARRIEEDLTKDREWKPANSGRDGSSRWTITGRDGRPWSGLMTVRETPGLNNQYTVRVSVADAGYVPGQGTSTGAPSAPEPPKSLAASCERLLRSIEHDIVGAAEAMPEEEFDFTPDSLQIPGSACKGVRTFAGQVKHLATDNFAIWSPLTGDPLPPGIKDVNGPPELKSRAEILRYLKESFARGYKAIASLTTENATDMVPFRGSMLHRIDLAFYALTHANDHYGQMVVYLRLRGIVPPASRPM